MTTLPAKAPDVWTLATDGDKLDRLTMLSTSLGMRMPTDKKMLRAAFLIALDGVTLWALDQATRAILQNALGHPFMPAPPELRGLCDKAMVPHVEERERGRQAAIREAARARHRALPAPEAPAELYSPAARAKVAALMENLSLSWPARQGNVLLTTRPAPLAPEKVAAVPDSLSPTPALMRSLAARGLATLPAAAPSEPVQGDDAAEGTSHG